MMQLLVEYGNLQELDSDRFKIAQQLFDHSTTLELPDWWMTKQEKRFAASEITRLRAMLKRTNYTYENDDEQRIDPSTDY